MNLVKTTKKPFNKKRGLFSLYSDKNKLNIELNKIDHQKEKERCLNSNKNMT